MISFTPARPLLIILHVLCLVLVAEPAWAVQSHGGAEGLVSHQIGHILFIAGMVYMLYRVHRARLEHAAWADFRWFLRLIILWNVITFTGHWMHEVMAADKYIKEKATGEIISFSVNGLLDAYFYLTRLDHLFLVPALAFLLLALRKWRAAP